MLPITHEVSIKGKRLEVPAFRLDNIVVVVNGRFLKVAEVFDEYWLETKVLPDPQQVVRQLREANHNVDLFTFAQRVPDTKPCFDFHMEWDNVAVIPVSTYETWYREQISSGRRRDIRYSEKRGVVVRAAEFDEKYIHGIMSIYNESPFRGGRKYWHYGKDFDTVQTENGTYRERSTFLAAYFQGEMIGYMKIVWDTHSASIMQILSKIEFREKLPNNALISEAVRLCAERKIPYLLYSQFVYGSKTESSLTRFKQANGFVRMDIPRYFVPLTLKGHVVLKLGLHGNPKDLIPRRLRSPLLEIRDRWYATRSKEDGRRSHA
ncbi:MAG: hypothetical protein HOP32_05355 [Nitrospira sp.]|nr:hypothetical protein [Nitrospira sp.]